MVFKTIESDLTKSGQSLAIFGKEWRDITNDMRNAKGLNKISTAFSSGLSKDDINRLKEYNHLIQIGQNPQSAYYRTLKNGSAAAQNLATSANGAAVSEEFLEQASRKSTVALKAQSIAMNLLGNIAIMGIITLISKGVKALSDLANHVEITREKVEDLKSTFWIKEVIKINVIKEFKEKMSRLILQYRVKQLKAIGLNSDQIEYILINNEYTEDDIEKTFSEYHCCK